MSEEQITNDKLIKAYELGLDLDAKLENALIENQRLQAKLAEARKVIEPLVSAFLATKKGYTGHRDEWFNEMPGDWPRGLLMTVGDCRAAVRWLENNKEEKV